MSREREYIAVAFEGGGAGEGELSWGQQENWVTITAQDSWLPLGGVTKLPGGMTVETIIATLRYTMGRNPSLRTRLRFEADRSRPIQVVHASGELALEIIDAGDADPAEVAEELSARYRETALDFSAEWPLRMAAILRRGQPTHMVGLISHLAADAAGLGVMMREMVVQDSAPVAGQPPLAQAAWQRSPAGLRHNAAAIRYWEEVFRTIDPHRFVGHHQGESPRHWHGEFESWTLLPAVRDIAAASGLGTSTVIMTLLAVAMNQFNGVNPVVIRPIVSNRFRPGLADVVCTVAQAGICVLDVAGVPFDEALRRVQQSVMKAYKYAYFNHTDMVAVRADVERERGVALDIGLFINDRHDIGALEPADVPPPRRFRWVDGQDDVAYEPLFVAVDNIPGGVRISLHLDTRSISLADAERVVRDMDAIAAAVAAAAIAESSSRTALTH